MGRSAEPEHFRERGGRMKTWYQMTAEEALRGMESSHGGLSSGQAEVRCGQFGENVLQEHAGKKIWQVFLEQFQDLLVLILIVAAAISVLSGSGESAAVIFAVITMNAVLGTIQHEKARKSLESLKKLSAPVAQVLRDGKSQEIPAAKVVPGDIVLLDAGSLVAADGRLLECYNLQVNESSLTGESLPVEKRAGVEDVAGIPLGDQYNMVFAGSLVTGGRGVFVVTATGMETELGKIARLMNMAKEKKTPLQVSLDQFSTHLAALILGICVLVFGLSLYRGTSVLESLMFAVALAVAAIPEALGSIVTIVQAMGTQQMAREHAIIKDLKAVESLGCVSVICSDKTGTLTQNRMTVEQVLVDGRVLQPGQLRLYDPVQRYFLYGAVLDNDAVVQGDVCTGDPTEAALLAMALRADVCEEERLALCRLAPFVVGRRAHVAAVVARTVVVVVCGAGLVHLFVFGKVDAAALVWAGCVVGGEVPRHPVGQLGVAVVRRRVGRSVQYLLLAVGERCRHLDAFRGFHGIRSVVGLVLCHELVDGFFGVVGQRRLHLVANGLLNLVGIDVACCRCGGQNGGGQQGVDGFLFHLLLLFESLRAALLSGRGCPAIVARRFRP